MRKFSSAKGKNIGKTKKYKEHLLKTLQDPEEAAAYLDACLEDEDPSVFLLALKDVVEARGGISKLSRETALSRQSGLGHIFGQNFGQTMGYEPS